MNNSTLRNVLILVGVVVVALIGLGILSTLLTQIVPIGIALLVGFIVGRLSTNAGMVQRITGRNRETTAAATDQQQQATPRQQRREPAAAPAAEAPARDVQAEAEAIKARLADAEEKAPAREITDFDIRTEDEVLAEASRLEDEIKKRAATYDPSAALEERRRRLLGGKADE